MSFEDYLHDADTVLDMMAVDEPVTCHVDDLLAFAGRTAKEVPAQHLLLDRLSGHRRSRFLVTDSDELATRPGKDGEMARQSDGEPYVVHDLLMVSYLALPTHQPATPLTNGLSAIRQLDIMREKFDGRKHRHMSEVSLFRERAGLMVDAAVAIDPIGISAAVESWPYGSEPSDSVDPEDDDLPAFSPDLYYTRTRSGLLGELAAESEAGLRMAHAIGRSAVLESRLADHAQINEAYFQAFRAAPGPTYLKI